MIDELLREVDAEINKLEGVIDEKNKNINLKVSENESLQKTIDLNNEKKLLLKEAADTARVVAYDMFANIATDGLQSVLGDNTHVEISKGELGGAPTADFMTKTIYDSYETIVDPTEADGGGAADIISLAAFICMRILNSNTNNAPLFLDEPTKFVSSGLASDVGAFLNKISNDYNLQIIMVTHAEDTKNSADNVFEVKLDDNGGSVVKKL